MSIHCTKADNGALVLVILDKDVQGFKEILARGLNTAPPEKYSDWIALADSLTDPISPSIQTPNS